MPAMAFSPTRIASISLRVGTGSGIKSRLLARQRFAVYRMASTTAFGLKDASLVHMQSYIDGKWIDAKEGGTIKVTNPATEEELGTVPEMGLAETKEAIDAAARAFKSWGKTTTKHRHDILKKFYALMQEHQDDLARIITLENGKPIIEAKGENAYASSFIEWFAEEALRTYGEVIPSPFPHIRNVVVKQPVGVVSILTPWNFPSAMITRKLGAALAAGCTTVIKPPPETPFSALALTELATRAGVPPGVINVVTTQANVNAVGREMCENPAVRKVTFTGSTPVAKMLYGYAAQGLKKVSIEAGGNAPFIVFDDADIDAAVEGAIACKFRQSGQTCVCANRFYVQSSVYADFASRLAEKVAAFKVGNGLDSDTTHGPLIHQKALDKVQRHIDDALARGAQLVMGGSRFPGKGTFFQPTLLSDVPPDALVNSEETFGPLAALTRFETEEQVISWANNSMVGLAGYFYSRDVARVWRVAEALEVGMVGTNTGLISQAVIPFGGVKESGIGREGSHGIEEYMNTKFIAMGGM
ncbi:succinate-semialdehyde dehydrogenase I [Wolfiporia cocos MD-104 SS10]|uniref:Succinate-semialdehyde dehydrogenase n=1 Tax=Wolfiporia cocos (strain MD-104) TaxID=742152 RepID=A0A2H3JFE5_WOLCO|nr:succinate-semialdehyde dehydrogenase I [Wolfiporia cocos MD-104 SS10]